MPGDPAEGETMVVSFSLDGQEYVGLNGGPQFTFSEAISFQIHCADQDEVDHYWERLSEGGEEGPCGWLKDKFGLSWQVVPTRLLELIEDDDKDRALPRDPGDAEDAQDRHRRGGARGGRRHGLSRSEPAAARGGRGPLPVQRWARRCRRRSGPWTPGRR